MGVAPAHASFKDLPIWTAETRQDGSSLGVFARQLRAFGGHPIHTDLAIATHGETWMAQIMAPEVLEWFFAQRRGQRPAGNPALAIDRPDPTEAQSTGAATVTLTGSVDSGGRALTGLTWTNLTGRTGGAITGSTAWQDWQSATTRGGTAVELADATQLVPHRCWLGEDKLSNRCGRRRGREEHRWIDCWRLEWHRRPIALRVIVSMSDVTCILKPIQAGQPQAAEELLPPVYDELRRIAGAKMAQERPGQTLQPTALVHEAWLRLGGDAQPAWENRAHFFAAAAEAMRRILVEKARRRQRVRHGGNLDRVDLDDVEIVAPETDQRVLQISDALDRLAGEDPVKAHVVKLRFFVGMSDREVAEALGLSERTVERHWAYAKVWLLRAVRSDDQP